MSRAWMTDDFTAELRRPHYDHPLLAYHGASLAPEEMVLAFRDLPTDAGPKLLGAKGLMEMARYALFIANCQADALSAGLVSGILTAQIPTWQRAIEIFYRGICVFAFNQGNVTLDRAIRTLLHEELGVADLKIRDRAAWNAAVKAVAILPRDKMDLMGMRVVTASMPFRVIVDEARTLAACGPISDDHQRDLEELAAMVLVGDGMRLDARVPAARTAFHSEILDWKTTSNAMYSQAETDEALREYAMDAFGIDPTRAHHLGQLDYAEEPARPCRVGSHDSRAESDFLTI